MLVQGLNIALSYSRMISAHSVITVVSLLLEPLTRTRPLNAHNMAMTPANDAFTLNNRYSHTHIRRSPRPSTRSPSPTTVAMGIGKLTRRNTRRLSYSGSNGNVLHDIGKDTTHASKMRQRDKDAKETKKIDWEIPRKTLHSSIGVHRCCCILVMTFD